MGTSSIVGDDQRRRLFTVGRWVLIVGLSLVLAFYLTARWTSGPTTLALTAEVYGPAVERSGNGLRLVCLNVAHGRGAGDNQTGQVGKEAEDIRANLDAIAELLRSEQPDIVCLQESDAPSWWSGNFDHRRHIGEAAGLHNGVGGPHVHGLGLEYGTAILAQLPLTDAVSHAFPPNPPTTTKGYVVARVAGLDVVSVHLDFANPAIRQDQVDQMITELGQRVGPLLIAGDFNCRHTDGSPVSRLAEALGLTIAGAGDPTPTYPAHESIIDYVLVPPSWTVTAYRVSDVVVSDHQAIIVDLEPVAQPTQPGH